MNITVVGTGYVGLVTGACFAEMGNVVTCVDIDQGKIERLKKGILPIYEPGLDSIVIKNHDAGRLLFTTRLADTMDDNDVFFIAVGTPPGEDGSADLQYVLAVAREIGAHMQRPAIIVDKSTVPVGTADKVRAAIQAELDKRGANIEFDVASNPEFLKEGKAVDDFMRPDRVIVGCASDKTRAVMSELYEPFIRNHPRLFFMGVRDAEMTKYAANAMLATKISFMNEIATLCEKLDVDVEQVRLGIGSDQRIGYHFIYPGCGYGGSCFPKDVKALIRMAHEQAFEPKVLQAVEDRNDQQKEVLFKKITQHFGTSLQGKTFAVWGLAFKPETDDMREASSKVLISALLQAGAKVQAFDPVAHEVAKHELPAPALQSGQLSLADNQYAALEQADALVLVTEWKPFRHPDFALIKKLLRQPVVFDGRNQYNPKAMREAGFTYSGIGR
ncbi:UDP-glucose 6-dehydrogenase TuaD [Saezia sanguinis]|uniref:UDP-glucose 6-dehydrogenase n=1 Tax=Saezia sanguinis TaxID=1965230 RepID=A0A433SA39_9BURK|nr:UDP-glucose/GDP-mannose dehydrogenase family protein [Saezia sanguinis]RUS65608.1 UDP-glucose 6-dehydrogenase TuaD [Saezia sanguinis]